MNQIFLGDLTITSPPHTRDDAVLTSPYIKKNIISNK
jgi:hypothetical protein